MEGNSKRNFIPLLAFFIGLFGVLISTNLFSPNYSQTSPSVLSTDSSDSSGPSTNTTATPTATFTPSPTHTDLSPTPSPSLDTSGTGGGNSPTPFFTTYTTDRLASVDEATLLCIKTRLTSYEQDRLRYLVPTTSSEQEELEDLIDKARVCFESYQETVKIMEASGKISDLPPDVRDCLIEVVGQAAYEEINKGVRQPTSEEKVKGEACFQGYESTITYQSDETALSEETQNCLLLALGHKRYSEITKGTSFPSASEREKAERCFGKSAYPIQKRPKYEFSDEIRNCLVIAVGSMRFEEIGSGRSIPTEDEKTNAVACFEKKNKVQEKILPIPPLEVPFLEEVPEIVKIDSNFTETVEIIDKHFDRRLVLSGKAPASSLVDIYIFSEPIVVSTEADENGDWVYRLNDPVSFGEHVAYASVKDRQGKGIRSAVYNFEILAAEPGGVPLLEEERASQVPGSFTTTAFLIIFIALTTTLLVYFFLQRKRPKKLPGSDSNRQAEGETGAGSVN